MAILRGLRTQLTADRRMRPGEVGVIEEAEGIMLDGADEINDVIRAGYGGVVRPSQGDELLYFGSQGDRYVDDITGLPLDKELCLAARKKEIEYFHSKGVWELRSVNEARARMGRSPISVRWVDEQGRRHQAKRQEQTCSPRDTSSRPRCNIRSDSAP